MSATAHVRQYGAAVRITVRVQPRASRSAVEGVRGDAWRVRVQAPPVAGAANAAVCRLLADSLRVPRRHVRLISGSSARTKIIEIDGMSADDVEARLVAAMEDR
ncbi:MAG TPA: DUF167 domain-containing protein [Gemmatimonadaceae bacterium]|nr:DUF167 domain-containing protein [Gemmatimonadaceae bacterium]